MKMTAEEKQKIVRLMGAGVEFKVETTKNCEKEITLIKVPEWVIKNNGGVFKVPNGITAIGGNVFAESKFLKDVKLPQSLKKIGNRAFYGCENLKSVDCSSAKLEEIGYEAFSRSGIKTAKLGCVQNILERAFCNCKHLEKFSMHAPMSACQIRIDALRGCDKLCDLELNSKVYMETGAISLCRNLSQVYIANNSHLEIGAFRGCSAEVVMLDGENIKFDTGENFTYKDIFYGCSIKNINVKNPYDAQRLKDLYPTTNIVVTNNQKTKAIIDAIENTL